MKYSLGLFIFLATSVFADTIHLKDFNVFQSLKLNEISKVRKKKSPFMVKPGTHQIKYRKDDGISWDSLNITFLALDKTAKFKIAKPLFKAIKYENTFTLPADGSLQAYSINSNYGKARVVKTWNNSLKEDCVLRRLERTEEVCEPAMDYIPFTYRDRVMVRRGGRLFCYEKPTTEIIWGRRKVHYKYTKTQADATFQLISAEGNKIVAQGDFLDVKTRSKRTKVGRCH